MKPRVETLLQELEKKAPRSLAEQWDNVGLLVGTPINEVSSILVGLDPSNVLIDEAISLGADTIVTHHPVIFKPISHINTAEPEGRLLQKALSHNINIIACHTNLDAAEGGVNDVLGLRLGLTDLTPLQPTDTDNDDGFGRIGRYAPSLPWQDFIDRIHDILKLNNFNIAGPFPKTVTTVALCGGSGSEFARLARIRGADVYLSSEIKHDVAVWANETGFCVIDGTHYATEKPAPRYIADIIAKANQENGWETTVHLSETECHPFVSVQKNI